MATHAEAPLTLEKIVATAEEVIRRFGPEKATVSDVARALGVSHAAVYRHVATKAALRDLVVARWAAAKMPPLVAIAAGRGSPRRRLRAFFDTLRASKRERANADPEVFAAYRALMADATAATTAHVEHLIELVAAIVRDGIADGIFRDVDAVTTARALIVATSRFHHPHHASEWNEPGIDQQFDDVWRLLMTGLETKTAHAR